MQFNISNQEKLKEIVSFYQDIIDFLVLDIFFLKKSTQGEVLFVFNEGAISKKIDMPTNIVGERSAYEQVGEEYANKLTKYYQRAFNGETVRYKVRMKGITFNTILMPCPLETNKDFVIGISQEVTEVDKLKAKIRDVTRELSAIKQRDSLVDVYNRSAMKRIVMNENDKMLKESNSKLALILLDIDRLGHINDLHGHSVGDNVLVEVGEQCSNIIRSSDYLGRWLGGQFLIVSPKTSVEGVGHLAERLRKKISEHHFNKNIRITASLGVVVFGTKKNMDHIIWSVEKAMYKAKRLGKNNVVIENIT